MTKILFLDVDGVLNKIGTKTRNCHGCTGLDPENVAEFKRIVAETDCKIVLSSTWRRYRDLCEELMRGLGLEMSKRFIGQTPSLESAPVNGLYHAKVRGDEILDWIQHHPVTDSLRFVIVDDNNDMGALLGSLVQTDIRHGLTKENADEIIRRLNT